MSHALHCEYSALPTEDSSAELKDSDRVTGMQSSLLYIMVLVTSTFIVTRCEN